jgi:PhnB protein
MSLHLVFDFSINKENKTVNVTREFAANLELVWDAWTKPELLDQWWAPRPYQTKTKSMDFREGGTWLYAMFGPNNETHWCRADYLKINTHKNYSAIDAFCDEEGNINPEFPRSNWSNAFEGNGNLTTVHITITYQQLADLE